MMFHATVDINSLTGNIICILCSDLKRKDYYKYAEKMATKLKLDCGKESYI